MVSAAMLSTAMGYLHLPSELAEWIAEKQFTPAMLLVALALFLYRVGAIFGWYIYYGYELTYYASNHHSRLV